MTKATDAGRPLSIYVGVGVGVYEHHNKYPLLEKAVPEVEDVGRILAQYGYDVHVIKDPERSIVADKLDELLQQDGLHSGGSLVILWSGHGEPAEKGGLNLITRNTKPGSAALLTPEYLADLAARTGANQVLLILDTCFSGGGVIPAAAMADAVWRGLPPDAKRVWMGVVTSTMDFGRAKDGAFGSRLIKLLRRGPDDSELKKRWSSHSIGVRGDDLIDALVKEWDIPDQLPKHAAVGDAWIMLPNPIYESPSPEYMDAHLRDAARGGEPDEDGFYFTGRIALLNRIVAWMREGKPGAFVVTGPPGIGKSAILGRIVSLSNHKERAQLLARAPLEHADPGEDSVNAHVHALRYTAERLVAAVDEQLVRDGFLPADAGGRRNREELQGAIQRSGKWPVIVVDGLEESGSESWRIAEDVLRTLSEISLVLVGTKDLPPADGPLSLIKALGAREVIDLGDATIRKQAESDLRRYVEKRLATVVAPAMDNSKVAEIVMELSREQHAGAFLLARFVTTRVRNVPVDTSLPNWRDTLRRSIEESIENHFADVPPLRRGGLSIPHAAGELLEALAWAKGPGLPDDIWPIVATALSAKGTTYERSDVYWLLGQAGHYIIEDGQGGRAVYRLVHQRLSDHFQPTSGTFPESATSDNRPVKVAHALVGYYQDLLTAGQLPQTSVYLWRYVWRHCADAGESGIDSLRLLFKRDKKAFTAQLARGLSALSKSKAGLGRWREASSAAQETTKIYRELVESDPTLRTDLAEALVVLGRIQALVGQPREAVDAAREAVDLFRTMDTANPAVGLPFASALTTLSLGYGQTGRLQEAVEPAGEAASRLRQLSSDNPAFGPDLAYTLTVLGLGYSQTGKPQKAVDAAREAVDLFRTMETADPAVRLTFAWALTVLGLGHSQTGKPKEGLNAAKEAVDLVRAMDTANPAVRLLFAWALTVLGMCHSQTGQPKEGLDAAKEAVDLIRTMDTANSAVGVLFALSLTVLGQGYSQTGQPQEAVVAAKEAVDLIRTMDTANPAVGLQFASALTVLGLGYSQTGQPKEGLDAAKEGVDLFRTMDTANPAVGLQFASALTVLGLGYSQTGQPQEAADVAEEAARIYQDLSGSNPTVLPLLAEALGILGDYYRKAGRGTEIGAQWEAAVDSQKRPGDKAFLLLRRAGGREQGNALAVDELIRAKSYLIDTDRERIADFHMVCRSRRSANSADFDATWRQRSGENPPQWLTLDESHLSILWQWINAAPLESARDFLGEHIEGLHPESSSVALDEIALRLNDPSVIGPFRNLLGRVFAVGVDEAYRPWFAKSLLSSWMSSDTVTTRTMLRERREELLSNDVGEALRSLLADKSEDPQLIVHQALLDLARTGQEDLAFQAMEDPTRMSALLFDLARTGDDVALDAMTTIMFFVRETDAERALPSFYKAIALVFRNQPDKAFDAVVRARRLDPTQVPVWLALLVELAGKQHNLTALAQALIAPLPVEAAGN